MRTYTRVWFPYPDALIEAGIKAMVTHSPIEERQEKAFLYYVEKEEKFLDDLESQGINTDIKKVTTCES